MSIEIGPSAFYIYRAKDDPESYGGQSSEELTALQEAVIQSEGPKQIIHALGAMSMGESVNNDTGIVPIDETYLIGITHEPAFRERTVFADCIFYGAGIKNQSSFALKGLQYAVWVNPERSRYFDADLMIGAAVDLSLSDVSGSDTNGRKPWGAPVDADTKLFPLHDMPGQPEHPYYYFEHLGEREIAGLTHVAPELHHVFTAIASGLNQSKRLNQTPVYMEAIEAAMREIRRAKHRLNKLED